LIITSPANKMSMKLTALWKREEEKPTASHRLFLSRGRRGTKVVREGPVDYKFFERKSVTLR